MFEKTADKLTRGLCGRGVIAESEAALYRYGFDMALTMLLNIISTAAVGLIFGMVFESIAFLVCYIPLRSYAGGYHSETPLRCYFLSLAMIAAVLSALKLLPFGAAGYAVIMAAGAALCVLLSAGSQDETASSNSPASPMQTSRFTRCFSSASAARSRAASGARRSRAVMGQPPQSARAAPPH